MNEKLLEETITKAQETISQAKDWNKPYEEQLKVLTEKKELLDQFYKTIKEFDGIHFYLVGAKPIQDNIFTIQARKERTTYRYNKYNRKQNNSNNNYL